MIKIGLIQASVSENAGENLARTVKKIGEAAKKGAEIVCLQELFSERYFPQYEDKKYFTLAETIPSPTSDALAKAAKENKIAIVGSVFEKSGGAGASAKYYNSSVVIDANGKLVGKYRKMHIPYDPRFYEKTYFSPGDLGFKVVDLGKVKIAPLVCWDQWFPEAARISALNGAQIIFYPTAIGWGGADRLDEKLKKAQLEAWEIIQRSHAIANEVFVVSVNRVGIEDDVEFWGNSFVCAPDGQLLAKGSRNKEEILIAECDLKLIDEQREGWPYFRDRRPDAYSDLTRKF
ncbi:Nitrilase [Candidatus Gugararchaeum adminiculabundum]|nr:Nitrilase [Candidatus Gugararchaeum adminiculabundum]